MSFNPRSPCGERRYHLRWLNGLSCFNPRSPCGERRKEKSSCRNFGGFNPRSPCGERLRKWLLSRGRQLFQSTLPVRGATRRFRGRRSRNRRVSIHAPRAGSDLGATEVIFLKQRFNPRSPCGERLSGSIFGYSRKSFNPRSPCGERQRMERRTMIFTHSPAFSGNYWDGTLTE